MADAKNSNFEFGIENFKPYADLQSIELGKITLIYGSNSSGKSSFIQSFLCAAQSSESSTCSLNLNGEFVECGTFDSILNRKVGDKNKEVVLKSSRSFQPLGSSFSIEEGKDNRSEGICFSLKLQIRLRSFFKKGLTPGVLDISKIELVLPQINIFKDDDSSMRCAWLKAIKPLSLTKGLYCLEDIGGQWMTTCIDTVGFIAEDLKQCLNELNFRESNRSLSLKTQVGYEISGRCDEFNLLCCASLRIGAWVTVRKFDLSRNVFSAIIFPSSMPYLEGDYFSSRNLGVEIRDLHNNLSEYYSCLEECSRKFSKIRYLLGYSAGDESKPTWGSIPILDESVEELLIEIKRDSNCIAIENKIIALVKNIQKQIGGAKSLGSSLMYELGEYSQRLIDTCETLDKSIEKSKKMLPNSIIYSEDQEGLVNRELEISFSQCFTRLFQLADEAVTCLLDSFSFLTTAQAKIGIFTDFKEDRFSFSDLEFSINECKQIYDEMKKMFASMSEIGSFLVLAAQLNDRVRISQRMIASKANDLDYIADSGKKEGPAIQGVESLLKSIKQFFKNERGDERSHFSSRSRTYENMWKFLPVFRSIEILPPNILKNRVIHLGPDRPTPKRSYSIDEVNSDSQLKYLPEWDNEKESLFLESRQNKYAKELACLDIPGNDIVRVNTSDPMLDKCSIGILKGTVITNICDLGFGVSQVMPLVIASKIPDKDLIVVQQPETHLHPKMQADLGDLLIDTIDKKRWLVETHSEVLMLRILRRIRAGKLSASDLKIYFVDQRDGVSRIFNMQFSDSGDLLTRWPKGFFAQESMEIF